MNNTHSNWLPYKDPFPTKILFGSNNVTVWKKVASIAFNTGIRSESIQIAISIALKSHTKWFFWWKCIIQRAIVDLPFAGRLAVRKGNTKIVQQGVKMCPLPVSFRVPAVNVKYAELILTYSHVSAVLSTIMGITSRCISEGLGLNISSRRGFSSPITQDGF